MSIVVVGTSQDGTVVVREHVLLDADRLSICRHKLFSLSDNITQLTAMHHFTLDSNSFAEIPAGVFAWKHLSSLSMDRNLVVQVSPDIGRLHTLMNLWLDDNLLCSLPPEIGELPALEILSLSNNALMSIPRSVGRLQRLRRLWLNGNRLTWIPMSLERLPISTDVFLQGNAIGHQVVNSRDHLSDIFAATAALGMIRLEATTLAIGLQDLSLPALVTLEIVDAAFPNSIPMHKKWNLITAVKHFHD